MGAARCLFGGARPVPATAVSATDGSGGRFFRCDAPRAWLRQAHGEAVELMLSVNDGQQYLRGDSMMFTYFPVAPVNGLSVTRIRPLGGPSAGGTLVHLRGARLANLGGQHCLFSTSLEPSPATWVGFEHLTCLAPRLPTPSTLPTSTAAGYKSISTRVLVSVNGVLAEASDPGPAFAYYLDEDFRIERIYPRGGPVAGGTNVTVTGFAFADLDDGKGLACQFGDGPVGTAVLSTSERARAEGRQQLVCTSPPLPGGGETVVVRVTNNGQDFTSAEFTTNVGFTYYRYEDDDE